MTLKQFFFLLKTPFYKPFTSTLNRFILINDNFFNFYEKHVPILNTYVKCKLKAKYSQLTVLTSKIIINALILLQMKFIVLFISLIVYGSIYFIITVLKPPSADPIQQLYTNTHTIVQQLVETKYFRIIRLNINQECPLTHTARICKSSSCRICRCQDKDIPKMWLDHQKIESRGTGKDEWPSERQSHENSWHVEDEENDQGEYFDLQVNKQSFTSYKGSEIWKIIYEQNCLKGQPFFDKACQQDKTLYRIISGIHASISTHIAASYSTPVAQGLEWVKKPELNYNLSEYNRTVLSHPDRINNLFFLYQIVIEAIKELTVELDDKFAIQSDSIEEDFKAITLFKGFLRRVKESEVKLKNKYLQIFKDTHRGEQYQSYFHNISRILNCVDCQKCKLFIKMQIYGAGTALKILFGFKQTYKRNEIVALINLFHKISISLGHYYDYPQSIELEHMESLLSQTKFIYFMVGAIAVLIYIFRSIDINKKVKNRFRHSFPNDGSKIE